MSEDPDMSRKVCNNCGGRGHIARDCASPEQYNCCGSTEHKKADCDKLDKTCDVCWKRGHLRAKCQLVTKGKGSGGGSKGKGKSSWDGGYSGGKQCYCCGSTQHEKWECPSKDKACDHCGRMGHLKAMCDQGDGGSKGGKSKGKGKGKSKSGGGICFSHRDEGNCQYGDECRFSHD